MSDHTPSATELPVRILEFLTARREALWRLAEELVAIDTQNPPGRTVEAIAYLEDELTDLGLRTNRVTTEAEKPNLLATLPGESDATLLFNGHLDTVPFEPDQWTHDPLGEWEDDRLYGRGATDMKGAVAAMIQLISAFVETETRPPVTLTFAFVSDEETAGHAGLPSLLENGHIGAEACIIGEPTCEAGLHSVTVADKGSIWLTLTASGEAAHGSRPVLGVNAIDRLLGAIEDIRGTLGSIEFDLPPEIEEIIEESIPFYTERIGQKTARELFTKPTVNLGVLEGGQTVNRVPDQAIAKLDIRLTAGVHTPAILSTIREVVNAHEEVSITDVSWSTGTFEPVSAPIVQATAQSAEAVANERIYRRSATGGGDAKQLRETGVPTVEFAFATETSHAVDEFTTKAVLDRNVRTYARIPFAYDTLRPSI